MDDKSLRIVWVGADGTPEEQRARAALVAGLAWGAVSVTEVARIADAGIADAVLLCLPGVGHAAPIPWDGLSVAGADAAVIVLADALDVATQKRLISSGVQDVVLHADTASLPQRVRLAVLRRRADLDARKAYATDLRTGLPNRQQLVEHMSQLLALREREPRPVSVLAFRIDGLPAVEAAHGHEAANVVRRKLAVRLRAGVRASDVVASLGADLFAVLLPSTESPADAERVVEKLLMSLRLPLTIGGSAVRLASYVGVAQYPQDGTQPDPLLRHATTGAVLGAYGAQEPAND